MYDFKNGGIIIAEKSKRKTCMLYELFILEFDRLGNKRERGTVLFNIRSRNVHWLAEVEYCVILYNENVFKVLTTITAKYRASHVNVNLHELVVKHHETSY